MTGELFDYGIYTEASDIRAHVSVVNRSVYVFPTAQGIAAIERERPPLVSAYQEGVIGKTAEGWLVKVEWIADLRRLQFASWTGWEVMAPTHSTSDKGRAAVQCVIAAMRMGRFPFWLDATEDQREHVQIRGTDIVVFCRKKVQVKCDWRGGHQPQGTGNLFIQKAERNPLKRR